MKFKTKIERTSKVLFDARLKQAQGIFDLPPAATQTLTWDLDLELPESWSVGAIVGESGSGKTTIARELAARFGSSVIEAKDEQGNLREPFEWARDKAVCSAMPGMPIREWTGLLSRVGFSSPPAWCRPYQVLSNGQQFRCNLARAIAESVGTQIDGPPTPVFFDEFASLVHDQVATIASAAVAKGVRQLGRRFVAVTWRTDILDHLEPDWVLFVGTDQTVRLQLNAAKKSSREGVRPRSPQGVRLGQRWKRPPIELRVVRTDPSAWVLFRGHHYLSGHLHRAAKCFVGLVGGRPAAFTAVLPFPHEIRPGWREHRTVCLPDFQGVGIGNAMSEFVASLFLATGKPYLSTTSHPAMIRHRMRSPLWLLKRKPTLGAKHAQSANHGMRSTSAADRLTAGFEYVGPKRTEESRRFGVIAA